METLPGLLFLYLVRSALAAPSSLTNNISSQNDDKFVMVSIGDSWAAGAAVQEQDLYNGVWDCYRFKDAWEAEMANENDWTDKPIDFRFVACSGAQLSAATSGDADNKQDVPQLKQAGIPPHLLTMQLGGNNCHFGDIARICIYGLTRSPEEYPDPESDCTKKIQAWERYIKSDEESRGQSYTWDYHEVLKNITEYETIKGRDDFYLYIVGYAAFFNTNDDSKYCDDITFAPQGVPIIQHPKLNTPLRTKINELIRFVNDVMDKAVKDMKNNHIKFLNPDQLFEGHRFCEKNHNKDDQYYLNSVWFWNLNDPKEDPVFKDIFDIAGSKQKQQWHKQWLEDSIFPNGTKATEADIIAMTWGSSLSGGRTFHPKHGGHTAIKDALIDLLRKNNVPGVKQAPPTPPKRQPYASGQVHMHIWESWSCKPPSDNLFTEIRMWDSSGAEIGYLQPTQAGASASARMKSRFEDELIITPEWSGGPDQYGYIQFQLGNFNFDTFRDSTKDKYCNGGGYDPREGPKCREVHPGRPPVVIENPKATSVRQMDCFFPAPEWRGGNPSDGTVLQDAR